MEKYKVLLLSITFCIGGSMSFCQCKCDSTHISEPLSTYSYLDIFGDSVHLLIYSLNPELKVRRVTWPNGNIKIIEQFCDMFYISDQLEYWSNGELKSKMSYHCGTPVGEYLSYYENGQLFEKYTYENGIISGEYISYHENGNLRSKGINKKGKRHGLWYLFSSEENGERMEILYRNGSSKKSKVIKPEEL